MCIQVRLALARILWRHPHLLVLDEVTTHLDFYTITALIEALAEFDGALLIVSHDRFLIRSVVENKTLDDNEVRDDNDNDRDGSSRQRGASQRRRTVYMIKDGILTIQTEGVKQYEMSLERRIAKLKM